MSINKDDNSAASATVPCQNAGCTFWGRPATEGYCSKCYKERNHQHEKKEAARSQAQPMTTTTTSSSINMIKQQQSSDSSAASSVASSYDASLMGTSMDSMSSILSSATPASTASPRKVQDSTNRCFQCSKKIGLTGIKCRCGYVYCGAHRYPDTHSCDFDFKKHDRDILAKSNEKVDGNKLADKL